MSKSAIRFQFTNLNAAQKIRRRVDAALLSSMNELGEVGVKSAQAHITARGAVASGDLLDSFSTRTVGRPGKYLTVVKNHATYAKYVNDGVRGVESGFGTHQYTTKKPPLTPLARWAALKLGGYRVNLERTALEPVPASADD